MLRSKLFATVLATGWNNLLEEVVEECPMQEYKGGLDKALFRKGSVWFGRPWRIVRGNACQQSLSI